ncbi:MAG TPA: hypothetical protein EYG51_16725 [Pseudomonadales bacterium]|nr:hypothetical protein [Pseudomonadales bacterium]
MNDLSKVLNLEFEELVRQAVTESVQETFGELLIEDERMEQQRVSSQLKDMRAQTEGEDVEEADDEEAAGKEVVKVAAKVKDADEDIEVDVEETEPQVLSPEELQQISVEDFVDLLNRFRSGESLKRKDVHQQLSDYWENLTAGEKKAIYAYAQGLSQIVTSDVPGAEAPDPSSYKIRTGDVELNVRARDRSQGKKTFKQSSSTTDAEEKIPIVVGERADKRMEKSRLRILSSK